jgi:hypothetical protein
VAVVSGLFDIRAIHQHRRSFVVDHSGQQDTFC